MATQYFELTSQQRDALQKMAEHTGSGINALISKAVDTMLVTQQQKWNELHHAIQEGIDSGDDGPLDVEDIIRRGHERLTKQRTKPGP